MVVSMTREGGTLMVQELFDKMFEVAIREAIPKFRFYSPCLIRRRHFDPLSIDGLARPHMNQNASL